MQKNKGTVLALALLWTVGNILGCAGDEGAPSTTEPPPQDLTVLPQRSAPFEVAASAASTQATGGVVKWKIYDAIDPNSTRIYGVDAANKVLTVSRIGGDPLSTAEATGVVMETLFPEAGKLEFDAKGNAVTRTLSAASGQVFAAMAADFKGSLGSASMEQLVSWRCWRAGVILGAACGVTIAGCLETVGLGCAVGGALCVAAYQDWLCECHHRCI